MIRVTQRSFAALCAVPLVALAASSCKQPATAAGSDGGTAAGPTELILTRVGNGTLSANPGDTVTLTALLVDSNGSSKATPVPGTEVTWKFTQLPGMVTFSHNPTTTSTTGITSTTVTIGQGFNGEVAIVANAPGATSKAIWEINVSPVIKHIQIIGNPPVVNPTDLTDDTATVDASENAQVTLHVRVTADTGNLETPVSNETVTFAQVLSIQGATFIGSSTPMTAGDGSATVTISAGTTTGNYQILATLVTGEKATFNVAVSSTVTTCNLSSQCGMGYVCVGGMCTASTTGPGSSVNCSDSDQPCPIGYTCDAATNQCTPISAGNCSSCPMGYTCDTATNMCTPTTPECTTNAMCPGGICQNGTCTTPTSPTIDVTGNWYTAHIFDVHDALPGWVQDLATAFRVVDQILMGQLNLGSLSSIVDPIIAGLVQQYVPSWVVTLVYTIDNIFTIFSNLEAAGQMNLVAVGGNPNLIDGTEVWDSFIFYLLAQCGGAIAGNPSTPPPCAQVDVYTSQLAAANLSTTVKPFTAKVEGPAGGPYILAVDPRQVELELAGIIEYVINQVISTTTGYPSLQGPPGMPQDGALYNLVDCPGIAQFVESIIPIDITSVCQAAIAVIADEIAQVLSNIVVTTNVLSFSGQATALPDPNNPSYAYMLGQTDWETRTMADGVSNAEFLGIVGNVPGRWHAERMPFSF